MNLFNRIVVILLLLALAAGAIAIAVLAWTIPNRTINWLAGAVQWLDDNDGDTEKALLTAGAVVIALIASVLLLLELLPRAGKDVRVTDLQGGQATLSASAVAQRLEEAIRQVPHVADAKATVRPRRKGVEVAMDLHVDPDANLAEVTDAASEAARDVLSNRMHVALVSPPRARLHYRELRLRRPGTPEPASTSSNTTVVPALPVPTDEASRPEATEAAGWRPAASPDNTEDVPQPDIDAPATDKPAKPEPETENKFE